MSKLAGFLTGAGVAAVGVWGFFTLTTVSDDNLLSSAIADHCLPYVQAGATPYAGEGRSPGVYDNVSLRDAISDGGARIVYDDRYVVQWGVVSGAGRTSRFCELQPRNEGTNFSAFQIDNDRFVSHYNAVFGFAADTDTLDFGPTVTSWYENPEAQSTGLRAVFSTSDGFVLNAIIMDDLTD